MQTQRPKTRAVLALLALLIACLALPSVSHARKRTGPPPRYWGAWIGPQLTGEQAPWDMSAVSRFQSVTGKGLSIIEFSTPFANCSRSPCDFYEFPAKEMQSVRDYGAIPLLGWGVEAIPVDPVNPSQSEFQLSDVISGSHDSYIRSFANAVASWGHPFFLRFNWEMNGNWFPWAEGVNGNLPGEYVTAWRHVHDIFTSVGATNATWVWCPYADPRRRFRPMRLIYPGDAYVDWTCIDGFNWGRNPTNPVPWASFDKIFADTYRRLVRGIAPKKPVMLAELASTGSNRNKAAWIRNMFRMLRTKYRRIRALVWFNQFDRGVNWPLETSPAASHAFRHGVHRGYRANLYANIGSHPVRPPHRTSPLNSAAP